MTTTSKSLLAFAVVGALAGLIAFFNFSPFHEAVVQQLVGASDTGSTFNTAKTALIAVAPTAPGTNATSSSILNTDANDRYIISEEVGCSVLGTSKTAYSGTGLSAFTVTFATSSTAAPATAGSLGQTIGGGALTIATSSAFYAISSSTAGVGNTAGSSNVWLAGSYLTMQFNATNTAACTVGVRYLPA